MRVFLSSPESAHKVSRATVDIRAKRGATREACGSTPAELHNVFGCVHLSTRAAKASDSGMAAVKLAA